MDPLTIGLALATQFAPSVIKYFSKSETAGVVAGQVIEIAKTVTGKGDPMAAKDALQADPALVVQFQLAIMANDADLEKAHLADRANARARDVAMAQAGKRNVRADIMVLLDVVGLIACLVVLVFYKSEIPGEAVALIASIAATFGLCLRDAHTFEFGSSRGSQSKDATISNLTK